MSNKKEWKSIDDAVKDLGKEKALKVLNHGYNDMEYRTGRRQREQQLLKVLRKDPKYMDRLKG